MGKLDDYSLDQVAGALALVVSSLGGLLLIVFKSRCTNIRLCCGLWECQRAVPTMEDEESDEEIVPRRKNIFPIIDELPTRTIGNHPTPREETDTAST